MRPTLLPANSSTSALISESDVEFKPLNPVVIGEAAVPFEDVKDVVKVLGNAVVGGPDQAGQPP
jgi:hypothetical protein